MGIGGRGMQMLGRAGQPLKPAQRALMIEDQRLQRGKILPAPVAAEQCKALTGGQDVVPGEGGNLDLGKAKGGIQLAKFNYIFTNEYMREHRLVEVRLTEQVKSGTIVIDGKWLEDFLCVARSCGSRRSIRWPVASWCNGSQGYASSWEASRSRCGPTTFMTA